MMAVLDWTGDIPNGTVWGGADIHRITGDARVPAGATLNIEPGAVIKFGHFSFDLTVAGTLNATGTAQSKITFTELRDDIGGDTNGDGTNSTPGPGNWGRIRVDAGATATIAFTDIRFGGFDTPAQLLVDGGGLTLSNSTIARSSVDGVRVQNANPTLTSNRYENNADAAISMDLSSNPVITGVTVSGNPINGLELDGGTLTQDGFWNDAEIVYVTDGDISIPAGLKLTVGAGQTVKFGHFSYDLFVNGTLDTPGTGTAPITFTEFRDDTAGGDTNNDGTASGPGRGFWGRIELTGTGNVLRNVNLRHGGFDSAGMLTVNGGQLDFADGNLENSSTAGLRIQNSDPTITRVAFRDNVRAAATMDLSSNPRITGSSPVIATSNGVNGLLVDAGTMTENSFWDDSDIVYVTNGDITVPAGLKLTIGAGQAVKFGHFSYDLFVNGTLDAQGTATASITFTEFRDDTVGEDTNNDGTNSGPGGGFWGRIELKGTGNVLRHVNLRHGGFDSAGMLTVNGGQLDFVDGTLEKSSTAGLRIQNSDPTITRVAFRDNVRAAATMDLSSNPVITGGSPVIATSNGVNGLLVDGGTLTKDSFWNDPDIIYVTNGDITVPAEMKLTVGAGQTVKFGHFSYDLFVQGTLDAQATAAASINFTEFHDDIGGDTNNDGTASGPGRGNWGRIELTGTGNILRHVHLRHGGFDSPGMLTVNGGGLDFADGSLEKSSTAGLRIANSDPTITRVAFRDNIRAAVTMDLGSNPVITGGSPVIATDNGVNGLLLDGGELVKVGFWNDPDIVYVTNGDITIPTGMKLTVGAGQTVKFGHFSYDLFVLGTLDAQGAASAPITFTEFRDDTAGGDTNNDESSSAPGPGNWGRIDFSPGSLANVLNHSRIRFGGFDSTGMLQSRGAPLSVGDSAIVSSSVAGLRIAGTTAVLSRNTYENNVGAAISADLGANPVISGATVKNNGVNALVLDAGSLYCHMTWDDPDVVYRLSGDVIVPESVTLTIAPGQVVKARTGAGDDLIVRGTLNARGTVAQPILFTSDRDDTAGGDTDNSGATAGGNGNWNGIQFSASSENSALENAEVRFGGAGVDGWSIAVDASSVSVANAVVRNSSSHGLVVRNGGQLAVTNSIIVRNSSAGIRTESSTLTAANNTIDGNSRGLSVSGGTATLTNNLVTNQSRSGIFAEANAAITAGSNLVFNPTASSSNYEGLPNQTGSNGNLSADPLYVDQPTLSFELTAGSPAIDSASSAGAPASDRLGRGRVDDPAVTNTGSGPVLFVDRGALERQTAAANGESNPAFRASAGEHGEAVTTFIPLPTAASVWTNSLNPWDVNEDGFITPNDVLRLINDLNLNGARPLPGEFTAGQPRFDVNGDGSESPQDALVVINQVNLADSSPVMAIGEVGSLFREESRLIELGQAQGTRSLRLEVRSSFVLTDTRPAVEDTLLLYLLDSNDPTRTLIDRGEPGTAFFALAGDKAEFRAGLVRFDGRFIDVDLSGITAAGQGRLLVQLLNSDTDQGGKVLVHLNANALDPAGVPPPALGALASAAATGPTTSLTGFAANSDLEAIIDNVRLQSNTGLYRADVRLLNHGPAIGRNAVVAFGELPTGVTLRNASGAISDGRPYLNLHELLPNGGLPTGGLSRPIALELANPTNRPFQVLPEVQVGPGNQPPTVADPGTLSVMPGGVLAVPLSASDPDGDDVTVSVRGLESLPNGTLHGDGILIFRPVLGQEGAYPFTIVASDGATQSTRPVTLNVVADTVTTTRVSGFVLKTNDDPIPGIRVEIGAVQGLTADDGSFRLDLGSGPLVADTIKIRGELLAGSTFPFIAEKLPLLLEHPVQPGVNNVIDRPIFLPAIDVASGSTIDPAQDTTVTTPALPGAAVMVKAGTLLNQQGTAFNGVLSITEVPPSLTPAALPTGLRPGAVVTIQPGEMVFAQPAPLSMPNLDGWAAGTELNLWSINPTTGEFDNVGTGRVTADGSKVETVSGGVRNSSWHFYSNNPPSPTTSTLNPNCSNPGVNETPETGGGSGFS